MLMLEFPVLHLPKAHVYSVMSFVNHAYTVPKMPVLFDTGATISVWVGGSKSFEATFPSAVRMDMQAILSGFGSGYDVADVCRIPEYHLKDSMGNTVMIKNLYVAVTKRDFSFRMILSFPVFEKMNYQYISYTNQGGHKQINPLFRLYPSKSTYMMSIKYRNITDDLLYALEQKYPGIKKRLKCSKVLIDAYTFTQ